MMRQTKTGALSEALAQFTDEEILRKMASLDERMKQIKSCAYAWDLMNSINTGLKELKKEEGIMTISLDDTLKNASKPSMDQLEELTHRLGVLREEMQARETQKEKACGFDVIRHTIEKFGAELRKKAAKAQPRVYVEQCRILDELEMHLKHADLRVRVENVICVIQNTKNRAVLKQRTSHYPTLIFIRETFGVKSEGEKFVDTLDNLIEANRFTHHCSFFE